MKKAGIEVDTVMGTGSVAEEIDHIAEELGADLIFMRAYGLSGVEIGSVADKVAQTAICSVFLVPASGHRAGRKARRDNLATPR